MDESFLRSQGIFNPDDAVPINIIGCGSIGSFTAITLSKMGFNKFNLYDGDTVGIENVGCQAFGKEDIGVSKVEALKNLLVKLTPTLPEDIICYPIMVDNSTVIKRLVTVLGLDSMKARKILWNKLKGKIPVLVDGRIGGQVIRVFTVRNDYTSMKYYDESLYSDEEASEMPCAEKNVADVAFFTAGMIGRAVRMFVSHNKIIGETCFDARTFSFYTTNDEENPA